MAYADVILADLPGTGSFYLFDEASGTLVDSGGGAHDGTPSGTITYQKNGPQIDTYALGLDSSLGSIVGCGDVFDFAGTASFSLEVWVKPSVSHTGYVFANLDTSAPNAGWRMFVADSADSFILDRRDASSQDRFQQAYPGPGVWSCFQFSYDGSQIIGYLNGAAQGSPVASTLSMPSLGAASNLEIGGLFGGGSFKGDIALPAIYPGVVLDATQADDHYQAGLLLLQDALPDADTVTTGWSTAPLYSKINDASDATVITATAS